MMRRLPEMDKNYGRAKAWADEDGNVFYERPTKETYVDIRVKKKAKAAKAKPKPK